MRKTIAKPVSHPRNPLWLRQTSIWQKRRPHAVVAFHAREISWRLGLTLQDVANKCVLAVGEGLTKGRIEFSTETGAVELSAGDILVDRGVAHGWRALGDEPAMTAVIILPANPIGSGATI